MCESRGDTAPTVSKPPKRKKQKKDTRKVVKLDEPAIAGLHRFLSPSIELASGRRRGVVVRGADDTTLRDRALCDNRATVATASQEAVGAPPAPTSHRNSVSGLKKRGALPRKATRPVFEHGIFLDDPNTLGNFERPLRALVDEIIEHGRQRRRDLWGSE
jgi:hypothetical protein